MPPSSCLCMQIGQLLLFVSEIEQRVLSPERFKRVVKMTVTDNTVAWTSMLLPLCSPQNTHTSD